jgi:zinc transport system ATP-binding protein
LDVTDHDAPLAVDASHVAVDLAGNRVLHDVDLQVRRGELVSLLGANGSGKSTLLRALVGVLPLAAGTVRLFDVPSTDRSVRARLGYVPQYSAEAGSVPATARETVASGLLGPGRWFVRSKDPRITSLMADVGLGDLIDRPITQMSGGQRQRVMIARALVRGPELLVLDEPFAGVDVRTQNTLATLLTRLVARGTTVVVVLHELGPLEPEIDRAVVLDRGRVVHDGPVDRRPVFDPGHDHAFGPDRDGHDHGIAGEECLGQEIVP